MLREDVIGKRTMEKNSKIKILNFNTFTEGGAALAAIAFNNQLNQLGFQSKLLVCEQETLYENVYEVPVTNYSFLEKRLRRRGKQDWEKRKRSILNNMGFSEKIGFSLDREPYSAKYLLEKAGFIPDIIVYHWITEFISIRNMYELSVLTGAHSVWMMMDNAPFTGGCHYPFDCVGYRNGCHFCPLFRDDKEIPHKLLMKKKNLLFKNMYIAGTGGDCLRAAQSLCYRKEQILHFLFPVDSERFVPSNSLLEIHNVFGLPADKKIIFIGASGFDEERKGLGYLIAGLTLLRERYPFIAKETVLLIAGKSIPDIFLSLGYDVFSVGRLSEDDLIKAYQVSDLFLNSSTEDSGPLMINQAIMCGTPVVTFELGVAYDLVHIGKTGYRAKLKDPFDLAKGLAQILSLSREEANVYSAECRKLALSLTKSIGVNSLINRIMSNENTLRM